MIPSGATEEMIGAIVAREIAAIEAAARRGRVARRPDWTPVIIVQDIEADLTHLQEQIRTRPPGEQRKLQETVVVRLWSKARQMAGLPARGERRPPSGFVGDVIGISAPRQMALRITAWALAPDTEGGDAFVANTDAFTRSYSRFLATPEGRARAAYLTAHPTP